MSQTRAGQIIETRKVLTAKKFKDFLRVRLLDIGVGRADTIEYTGHSLKRGSVQLYRSLNLRDEQVTETIQMKGPHAYANCCAAYNDCAPPNLPCFSSASNYIAHAEKIATESDWIHDSDAFEEFMKEIWEKTDPEVTSEM